MSRYRTDGLVYFALDATNHAQRVKIGYSSSVSARIDALAPQTLSGNPPILLALEKGGRARETELHEQFADLRLFGEWFRYEAGLRSHVEGLPSPGPWLLDNPDVWRYAQGLSWSIPKLTAWPLAAVEDGDDEHEPPQEGPESSSPVTEHARF